MRDLMGEAKVETHQRSARFQLDDMPTNPESAFSIPPGKEKISARVASETKKKLLVIIDIWKMQTKVETEAACAARKMSAADTKAAVESAVEDVDLTYVVDRLLTKGAQTELATWGGYPDTPDKLSAVLKLVAQQSSK